MRFRDEERGQARRDEERDVFDCEPRGRGMCRETIVQVALVVLFVVLAALAWSSVAGAFAFGN